jgi:hypothetical protein
VSLFVLLNRLVDFAEDKYAVVQSEDSIIIKSIPGKRSLLPTSEKVNDRSKAATFFTNPSVTEEIREGEVPASCWFSDSIANETIYEQSVYNPKYRKVLTLLTINN